MESLGQMYEELDSYKAVFDDSYKELDDRFKECVVDFEFGEFEDFESDDLCLICQMPSQNHVPAHQPQKILRMIRKMDW